ncbi:hypothetical protein HML84_10695 [Alcanivorax sp. IO_7]|nr:hypothetical protein HML84_10695 [Alcanivorax sp. IO_7]
MLTLAACDDPDAPAPPSGEAPVAEPPATQAREGLAGIWRPQGDSDLNALVLEDEGQLYLVGDGERRGLRWEKNGDGAVTLHYLGGGDAVTEDGLQATLDNPALTLEGDSRSPANTAATRPASAPWRAASPCPRTAPCRTRACWC